ncbi:MAG: hypothetical protein HUU01_08530 [Saprospiraceae bacterium]|nr:hypothetical protein [Saprospiraceae bacterium]
MIYHAIKPLMIILFLGCLFDMPYGYYQLVRFVAMIGFIALAVKEKKRGENSLFVFWIASSILVNPIFKIALGRVLWNIVDIGWVIILSISIWIEYRKEKEGKS